MSQYGAYMEDQSADQTSCPTDDGCVCDLLSDGTTLTSPVDVNPVVLRLESELPVPDAVAASVVSATISWLPEYAPPPRGRLCEFLASTACPVRGPACLQA